MQDVQTEIAQAQEQEAIKRVPKTGAFNEVSVPLISFGAFGAVGYFVGKWVGRMGDHRSAENGKGRFEAWLKVLGTMTFGLIAASVGIRHTREAKAQAVELAKRSVELEQHNAALASVTTRPVGTLIDSFDNTPEAGSHPLVQVSEAQNAGTLADAPQVARG